MSLLDHTNENEENFERYKSYNTLLKKTEEVAEVGKGEKLKLKENPIGENDKRLTFPRQDENFYWLSDHLLVYKEYGTKTGKGGGNPKKTLKNNGEKKIIKKLSIKTKKRETIKINKYN